MKRLLLAACLLLPAVPAFAYPGVNFAWGERCWTDNPVDSRTFACDSNDGVEYATGSFELYEGVPDFFAVEVEVDICSGPNALPDWWKLGIGGSCRAASLSASADFSGAASAHCVSPWQGELQSVIGAYQYGLNEDRIQFAFFMPEARTPLSLGVEYLAFRLAIDHQKTVGDDACTGCGVPLVLFISRLVVYGYSGQETLSSSFSQGFLDWYGAPWSLCYRDPVRNTTWGQVKGMYR